MRLNFVSRAEYKLLRTYRHYFELPGLQSGEYWLPEGGACELALQGVGEIIDELDQRFDHYCVACGTGTTMAGLIRHVNHGSHVNGFAALKGASFLSQDIQRLLTSSELSNRNWNVQLDYHFGGFAKHNTLLMNFIEQFYQQYHFQLDPVYTGKLFYGLFDLIEKNYFKPGCKLLAIHTGGLQGHR